MHPPTDSLPQPNEGCKSDSVRTKVNGPRHVSEILAEMPIVRLALSRRLDDPNWPTAQDIANAQWGLTRVRVNPQGRLELEPPGGDS